MNLIESTKTTTHDLIKSINDKELEVHLEREKLWAEQAEIFSRARQGVTQQESNRGFVEIPAQLDKLSFIANQLNDARKNLALLLAGV